MKTSIFIDSCAWNYLFNNHLDLSDVFPSAHYSLFQTNEVQIEHQAIQPIGKNGIDNTPLKEYIASSIRENQLQTTYVFGFASHEPDGSLSKVQVHGGFGQGSFQSPADTSLYASDTFHKFLAGKSKRNSHLSKNQADASLAARSFKSWILTAESPDKSGPLKWAAENGGGIVYIKSITVSGLSLKAYFEQLRDGGITTDFS